MTNPQQQHSKLAPGEGVPWYKQFWPWFIIALPASVVVASFYTLYLAISNPDPLVLEQNDYQRVNSELKAQATPSESDSNQGHD